jgi:hypothetical protein
MSVVKKKPCLDIRNQLDKSNRPSRTILKITEIDIRWIGCGCSLGRLDLSDRSAIKQLQIK